MDVMTEGNIYVFVYRTGLLSAVGHDLRLSLERFRIEFGEGEISGRFWPDSFRVDGALREGTVEPDALSGSDRDKILDNLASDVLETDRHPELRFEGQYEPAGEESWDVAGELEMIGVREPIRTEVRREAGRYRSVLELTPSRWGIDPYQTMLGALRLKDAVEIELDVPAEGEP